MAYAQAQRHYERVAEVWDDVPDAQDRTGADLAEVLKKAALCAISGHEEQRGLQLARQALSHLDPAAEPARAALVPRAAVEARALVADATADPPPGADAAASTAS